MEGRLLPRTLKHKHSRAVLQILQFESLAAFMRAHEEEELDTDGEEVTRVFKTTSCIEKTRVCVFRPSLEGKESSGPVGRREVM